MTDYYAVLKKAVSGFDSESGDVRRSVYDKARTALIGQLKSIDPPLTTSEISRQRLELEEAIRKVEREASAARPAPVRVSAAAAVAEALAVADDPAPPADVAEPDDGEEVAEEAEPEVVSAPPQPAPPSHQTPVAPEPPVAAQPPVPASVRPAEPARAPIAPLAPVAAPILPQSGQDHRDGHRYEEAEVEPVWHQPEGEPELLEAQPAEPNEPEPWSPEPQPPEPRLPSRQSPPHVLPPQSRASQSTPSHSNSSQWPHVTPAKAAYPDHGAPQGRREPSMSPMGSFDEPRFDADPAPDDRHDFSAEADWAPEPLRATPLDKNNFDKPRERRSSRRERDVEQPAVYVERPKRSRWPSLVLLALIVLMLGGIGALAWSQRAVVKDVVGDLIASSDSAKPSLSEDAAPDAAPAVSKNADRLGGAPEEAPRAVRTVDAEPADGEEADPLAGVMTPDVARPSEPAPEPEVAAETSAPAAAPDASASADESLVAQKAILYEQPTDGSQNVNMVNANVTWKFVANSPNGPEIQANLDVPDKNMKATLTIRKNNDSALPASHLVEIVVDTPANFTGGGIKSVPALVMKPTEESRGQPLDGAAAKVADGFFWIAFSNDARPMAQNVALLRERNWIDLPIVYNNDQRAILTFEKGTPGQRVFDKAMTAWGSQ